MDTDIKLHPPRGRRQDFQRFRRNFMAREAKRILEYDQGPAGPVLTPEDRVSLEEYQEALAAYNAHFVLRAEQETE